ATARAASVTLGCLVKGYFPEPVSVTWDAGTLNSSTVTLPAVTLDTGLSTTVSQVTISGAWAKQRFTCSVAHTPSATHTNKTFQGEEDPSRRPLTPLLCLACSVSFTPPAVRLFHSSCDPRENDTYTVQLLCLISGYTPGDIEVTWLVDGQKDPNMFSITAQPRQEEGVSLVWSRDSGKPVDPDPWKSDKQFNATVIIRSTLPVDAQDWIDGEIFKCTVTHPDLPTAIVRSISKAQGEPQVHLFTPPEEDQGSRDQLTLTCLVQNFFPADIFVDWLRNGQHMPSGQQSTTEPRLAGGSNQTYFVFSRLEVSRADWEQNIPFTCRVVHEAVTDTRTLLKTVSKRPGK
uniref:Ig-like domain-containing protein n=1 Tax=Oryctolagus cuniculus TaxID=9986 RepID=A0A5F9CFZ9_RABIT